MSALGAEIVSCCIELKSYGVAQEPGGLKQLGGSTPVPVSTPPSCFNPPPGPCPAP